MIQIVDVGPRDGLQNEAQTLSPELRAELVMRLARAGVKRIEAVSFVNPARVPQMAGAEEVLERARVGLEVETSLEALVLNEKGFDRARAVGVSTVRYAFAVSETFNRRNQNASVQDSLELGLHLIARARAEGVRIGVILATSFGCPFEGRVLASQVLEIAEKLLEREPDELLFADTIGVGVPPQVRELVGAVSSGPVAIGAHFHNTRNTAYANAVAALEAGGTVLDASVGGLGGCPFAPRATGNIATEDLLYLLEGMGLQTGVNLEALLEIAQWLEGVLGRRLPGQVYQAGLFPPRA